MLYLSRLGDPSLSNTAYSKPIHTQGTKDAKAVVVELCFFIPIRLNQLRKKLSFTGESRAL
ncbi:hypothetical protein PTI98_005648 [Pleurotus ostreatus]|nr:hypothetical protein PTI98_005648 [Pleurotus ostreatus]